MLELWNKCGINKTFLNSSGDDISMYSNYNSTQAPSFNEAH